MDLNTTSTSRHTINITKEYPVDYKPIEKKAFAEFIREKRKEYNEYNGKELSTRDLGNMIGIEYEMFRKILNQEKPTKKRDCIIAICAALHLTPGETDEALGLYQYMPALDKDNPRERFIIAQLKSELKVTISELNERLLKRGFPGLDIQNKRDGKKKAPIGKSQKILPYKVLKLKVHTPIGTDYYYGDPYNSLCTTYAPSRCRCTGDMFLDDKNYQKYIRLIADTDGFLSSQICNVADFPVSYNSIDETGNYKNYFIELQNAVNQEKRRLLDILNDSKNYHHRCSARLIGDSICVFVEEFNYTVPELNEYYLFTLLNGRHSLKVYEQSAFMYYYLSDRDYQTYYGNIPTAKEQYASIEQIEKSLENLEKYSEESIRYNMRRHAFIKLQPFVDELYKKIKDQKKYIQNLKYIYDNPADVLRYYAIEKDFKCIYDAETGEISGANDSANYTMQDGSSITVTLNDIYRAFELGFPGIEEIRRIKSQYGSIESVLD